MPATNPKPREMPDEPAIIRDHHEQYDLDKSGSRKGWMTLTVFERAYRKGKLKGDGETEAQEFARYEAGNRFTALYDKARAPFPGGSDFNRVRAVGVPGSFVDHEIDAKKKLATYRKEMGKRDFRILELVLGEDHEIAHAVLAVTTPHYRDSTLARFRESLDALGEAMGGGK